MIERISSLEREMLLKAARMAIKNAVFGKGSLEITEERIPERLKQPGATFITITKNGILRGCVGGLKPTKSVIDDVCEHAAAAAMEDFRFPPLEADEIDEIKIEISLISRTRKLNYSDIDELLKLIQPGVDGVIVKDGGARATFLPQVWLKIPEKEKFLNHLCQKMGAPPDLWKKKKIEVLTYQVEKFTEK